MIDQIFIDLDDVLNRFTMHALRYMGCRCGLDDRDFPIQVGYNIHEACNLLHPTKNDWTPYEFWTQLPYTVWHDLPRRPNAIGLLRNCVELVGEKNVFILTKSLPQPEHYAGKMAWIYNNLPGWICNQVITSGQKETNARPGALLIDDADQNVDKFRSTRDGNAILMPRPWNTNQWMSDPDKWVRDVLKQLFKIEVKPC